MEQLLTTLETTLQAIRKKQAEQTNQIATLNSQLQEKDNQIATLKEQLQPALPMVSVTAVPVFDAGRNAINVEWVVSADTEKPLKVQVRHTDMQTGTEKDYTWDVEKKAAAVYSYPLQILAADNIRFTILPGSGYTIGTSEAIIPVLKPEPPKVKEQLEPLKITRGGTYEHKRIVSRTSAVACVELETAEEVVFADCEFENAGYAIKNHDGKTNLKVIRCRAKGLPHDGTMNDPRRFLSVNQIINLVVLNCQTEHMGFLTSQGTFYGSGSQGIKVLHNHVRNVSGLVKGGRRHANFVQLMNSSGIPNVEIAYNGVYNEYGQADVEDNINLYNARGTAGSRMQIHDNLIYGAYYHPSMEQVKYYSGGGIITDTNKESNKDRAPAYIDVYRNYIIATGNYGLGMAGGHNLRYYDNVVVNAAILPSGKPYHSIVANGTPMNSSGLWADDYYKNGSMFANSYERNTVGVNLGSKRNDISVARGAAFTGTIHLPGPITKELEQKYVAEWEARYKDKLGIL